MNLRQVVTTAALAVLALSAPLSATAGTSKGSATVDGLVHVFQNWKGDKADPNVLKDAAAYIDYDMMASRSLGADQWQSLKPAQKREFVAALRSLMEYRYYPRWHKIFSKAKVNVVSESASGSDTLVKSNLVVGKKSDPLSWRLANNKIISLQIEDKDLLSKLKDRLQAKLKKSNFDSLLSWMQERSKQTSTAAEISTTEAVIGESK